MPYTTETTGTTEPPRKTRWLSQDFTQLVTDYTPDQCYDLVIIGSGYGGAMAAAQLAGSCIKMPDGSTRPARVCVLERGQEYLPGSFASNLGDLGSHLWPASSKTADTWQSTGGLFDFRLGADVSALVASGLGGGSLINGGVMLKPDFSSFDSRLPKGVQAELMELYDEAKELLGARKNGADNSIARHSSQSTGLNLAKTLLMQSIAKDNPKLEFDLAPITVTMGQGVNAFGVQLPECTLCGDCATGCNVGAKESLDTNLLVEAKACGAEIYTGASVWRLKRTLAPESKEKDWVLEVVYTDPRLQERMCWSGQKAGRPLQLRAHRVIVAAGTYGSTELLLRSRQESGLSFSECLGRRFSGNGDNLGALYKTTLPAHSVAKPGTPITRAGQRNVGPTVTALLKFRQTPQRKGFYLQEFSSPALLRMPFEETVTSVNTLRQLPECNTAGKQPVSAPDPLAVDGAVIEHSLLLGLTGHDQADGRMILEPGAHDTSPHNWRGPSPYRSGSIRVVWPQARYDRNLDQAFADADSAVNAHLQPGGGLLRNPLTYPLPPKLEGVLSDQRGPVLTVHPLGGCSIGTSAADGVVDAYGAVFRAETNQSFQAHDAGDDWQGSLLVLDGSIIPTSLGANPSLTIATLSLRAARHWAQNWPDWKARAEENHRTVSWIAANPRPHYRQAQDCVNKAPVATEMQLIERLQGAISPHLQAELTMGFKSVRLDSLKRPPLSVDIDTDLRGEFPYMNRLRIFDRRDWDDPRLQLPTADNATREAHALITADLEGHLEYFLRDDSGNLRKAWRGGWSYLGNRGVRDLWRVVKSWASRRPGESGAAGESLLETVRSTVMIAAHAGEVRRVNYRLTLRNVKQRKPVGTNLKASVCDGDQIWGEKLFTYRRRSNPWNQLLYMKLTRMPLATGLGGATGPEMKVDARYFATEAIPLMRITKQDNQIDALADVASFMAFFARVLLDTHFWSFRRPDDAPERTPQRLPGPTQGLPAPMVVELALRHSVRHYRGPVFVRLTRYAADPKRAHGASAPQCPLLFIHGYSASGTSFAHPSLQPGMAQHFWELGYDVWLLDLRTSPDLPSAAFSWSFEDVAWSDIPVAIDYVTRTLQQEQGLLETPQVDVFAHCIGAVMFSMALLTDPDSDAFKAYSTLPHMSNALDPDGKLFYETQIKALPARIRKVVMSQKSFALDYSDANVLRSFLMRYFRRLLGNGRYKFRPDKAPSLNDRLTDLLLSTLPYPVEEYDRENPPPWKFWHLVPWARTRHRMDALYQHTFDPGNLGDQVLEHLDDQFGPININTVAQILHIARKKLATTTEGKNIFVSGDRLRERWTRQGTLLIYNAENKMVDRSTTELTRQWMVGNGLPFASKVLSGMAHQDGLIGKDRHKTFYAVQQFLQAPTCTAFVGPLAQNWQLQAPWVGPRIARGNQTRIWVGADPGHAQSRLVVLPVRRSSAGLVLCNPLPEQLKSDRMASSNSFYESDLAPSDADVPDEALKVPALVDVAWQIQTLEAAAKGADGFVVLSCLQKSGEAELWSATITRLFLQLPQTLLEGCFVDKANLSSTEGSHGAVKRFVVTSCKYPSGVFDRVPASWSLEEIVRQQPNGGVGEMLMLGDQIYADASAGLLDPSRMDDRYQRPYEDLFRIPALRTLLRQIPVHMILDDHEIAENWEPGGNRRENKWFAQGLAAWWRYQRADPQALTRPGVTPKPVHGASTVCGFPMYLADTRTERTLRNAQTPNAAIMSVAQMGAIQSWMSGNQATDGNKQQPLFIACPAMILPRPLSVKNQPGDRLLSDSWAGYPASMDAMLGYMAHARIQGAVFLSGDEHLGNLAEFTLRDDAGHVVSKGISIHVPGLYAPIPFANADAEMFVADERFPIHYADQHYVCEVHAQAAAPGNGFVSIEVQQDEDGYQLVATTHLVSATGVVPTKKTIRL